LTKSLDWKHEKEWRITGGNGFSPDKEQETNLFERDDVKAVVFGANCDTAGRNALIQECKPSYPKAHFFQARLSNTNFALNVDQLD
jgi:hypothetical protein